jgi:redox-sensitive bicupin YhaK (pirin superfamily)
VEVALGDNRGGWIQVVKGEIACNGVALEAGDGASVSKEKKLVFEGKGPAEFLFFDLK